MIPKRIFYVWGAGETKRRDVLACVQSWREVCSEYELIEINEKSSEYFNFQQELQSNEWFRAVYQRRMWAYVADYVRVKVLHDEGGIYLDTDVTVLKNFDRFLTDKAFVGMQDNSVDGKYDLVEPAVLGAQKGNKVLEYLLEIYQNNIWTLPIYTMPDLFNYALKRLYPRDIKKFPSRLQQNVIKYPDIKIYPEKIFIPFRYREEFSPQCISKETNTIHWWGASWIKPEILNFLKTKSRDSLQSEGYVRCIYLFGLIPILRAFIGANQIKIAKLTICSFVYHKQRNDTSKYSTTFEVKLFGKIPFFKIKIKEHGKKKKYYICGILVIKLTS